MITSMFERRRRTITTRDVHCGFHHTVTSAHSYLHFSEGLHVMMVLHCVRSVPARGQNQSFCFYISTFITSIEGLCIFIIDDQLYREAAKSKQREFIVGGPEVSCFLFKYRSARTARMHAHKRTRVYVNSSKTSNPSSKTWGHI